MDSDFEVEELFELMAEPLFADLNKSTESLGSLSQHSNYSDFGDADITDIIREYPCTDESPPTASSSSSSLGKRKSSELSIDSSGASSQQSSSRPSKVSRSNPISDEAANPFLERKKKVDRRKEVERKKEVEDPCGPICYAPSKIFQRMFHHKKLPYGVQYELARCVSHSKFNFADIHVPDLDIFSELKTNEKAAPLTLRTFLKPDEDEDEDEDGTQEDQFRALFLKEHAAKFPWKELDREEGALAEDPYSGLGFNKKGERIDWHGGQVVFTGRLQDKSCKKYKTPPIYKIVLEQPRLGPSTMFSRRFGSKHFFRVKMPNSLNKNPEKLTQFFQRPLFLCGFVFRAFYAKESNVFYVKTNEVTDGSRILHGETIPGLMSFLEFLDWHNPMKLNSNQKMAKYVSRFALGLSSSVPGLMIDQSNIHFADDIVSSIGSNMTDGAGKINRWSLRQIRHRLDWEDKPTAIQMRLFGTKGLLIDDGRNADEFGYVELTPSQQKIKFAEGVDIDPAHRCIDVLRASRTKAPCRLSVETIVNLSENGVPKEVFTELLRQSLSELVEPLLDWESPDAMRALWCNLRRIGGVMVGRRTREAAGAARAKGFSEREAEEFEREDEDDFAEFDSAEQRSSAWWGDEVSGCPSSLEETVMCMLDSNLTPQECPVLRDRLHKIIKSRVREYIKSYRIDVPLSASAFLVPDTDGILEEGEVFFKSSHRLFRNPDGTETDLYTGDILLTRYPCKLPTDTQKWKSVDKPALHYLVDVIVLSTKGERRAADWLAGGDYDGDKGVYIYQPEVVQPFENAPAHLADPPADIEKNFLRKNEDVSAFLARTAVLSVEEQIRERQHYLLGAVRDTSVYGSYSNFHEIATYQLGYRHRETLRLAHIFNATLDGVKTGKTIAPEIYKADRKKYDKMPPMWKAETEEEKERNNQRNEARVRRQPKLGKFIMDVLYDQATNEGDKWHARIDEHFSKVSRNGLDEDLAGPWNRAVELGERWATEEGNDRIKRELEGLKKHVARLWEENRTQMLPTPRKQIKNSPTKGKSAAFTDLPIEVRQDKFRILSKAFIAFPRPNQFIMADEEVARIRASYAYVHDFDQKKSSGTNNFTRFPWNVAMRELCAIKARATGRHKTVSGDFYDHFNMKHPNKHHF